ncbi:MAG: hypothetical protein EBZ77_06575 [Chitinophagia bacterium]|nr:hypothetical protein [Chitinophagia bacterium]
MRSQKTLKYLFTALCSLLLCGGTASAQQADTTAVPDTVHHEVLPHQLTLGADISAPLRNALYHDRTYYELAASYFLHNELYLDAEAGWGTAKVNYTDLNYTSTNTFVRAGFHRVLLPRETRDDWGGMLLGLQLGAASVSRSAGTYTVVDSFWGNTTGNVAPKNFGAVWFEVTGGVRVELVKGLMAGWNIRGKFMLNAKSFNELSPLFIAGYGRGDKNAVFDANFYMAYALRWKRKG